jgi:hypothetical protein
MAYAHKAGTTGTVTVPSGAWIAKWTCLGGAGGGTVVITPAGGSAQDTITVPASASISDDFPLAVDARGRLLGEGSTITFAGTSSYLVRFA